MTVLLSISIAILAGLLMTRVLKVFKLPSVTAYLIAGILVGPYCLGRLGLPGLGFTSMRAVDGMGVLTNTALGFIAFSIGNEFRLSGRVETFKFLYLRLAAYDVFHMTDIFYKYSEFTR